MERVFRNSKTLDVVKYFHHSVAPLVPHSARPTIKVE